MSVATVESRLPRAARPYNGRVQHRALLVALTGCGFSASVGAGDGPGIDGGGDAPDGPVQPARDLPHLPPAAEVPGSGDVTVDAGIVIDTGTLTVTPAVSGLVVEMFPHDPAGPELAVIRVARLTITADGVLRATGARPLVIVADHIEVRGQIDVSANGSTAGAGAATAEAAFGAAGTHAATFHDSGGGGGGGAAMGASGGSAGTNNLCGTVATGAGGGGVVGDAPIAVLVGGGRGGAGSRGDCAAPAVPGGGGGALQLSARARLIATGVIDAGGGGGGGGVFCNSSDAGSGGGGGAGGAIYLDAPELELGGTLAANGGGGGGGGCGPTPGAGGPGDDAMAALAFAGGGSAGGCGTRGGDGATGERAPMAGANQACDGNAGGGGGAVGRIVVRGGATGTAVITPAAHPLAY